MKLLHQTEVRTFGDFVYVSMDGDRLAREEGKTPNGNDFNQRWVLRDPAGKFVDVDRYRHDIMERNGFKLEIKQ